MLSDANDYKNEFQALLQIPRFSEAVQGKEYALLSEQLADALARGDQGELFLLRAQVKLLAADATFVFDLEQAQSLLPGGSAFQPFLDAFVFQAPNSFILFSGEEGALLRFIEALRGARGTLRRLCGESVLALSRQIESEILYYLGDFRAAIGIAAELIAQLEQGGPYDRVIIARHVLLRCYLAMGDAQRAHGAVEEIIKYTKAIHGSLDNGTYQHIRSWLNLTTGWCGDTERYHVTPSLHVYPAFEDRAEAIRNGIGDMQSTETPIVRYAELTQPGVYTLRGLYVEVFEMLLLFRYSTPQKAMELFQPIYAAMAGNRMLMAFVEYGEQVTSFLEHAAEQGGPQYDTAWLRQLAQAAEEYEACLRKYRQE